MGSLLWKAFNSAYSTTPHIRGLCTSYRELAIARAVWS